MEKLSMDECVEYEWISRGSMSRGSMSRGWMSKVWMDE